MTEASKWQKELYSGLQSLAASSFPKKCNNCGQIYQTAEDYIKQTNKLQSQVSGLKQSYDEDDSVIVELYRNCECGSTLLNFFTDRRDTSPNGLEQRRKFDKLLDILVASGLTSENAHVELIKVLRGEVSEQLQYLLSKEQVEDNR